MDPLYGSVIENSRKPFIEIAPDGTSFVSTHGQMARLWRILPDRSANIRNKDIAIRTIDLKSKETTLSPDGSRAIITPKQSSQELQLVEVSTGKVLRSRKGEPGAIFSPDSRHLYVFDKDAGQLNVYSAADGSLTKSIPFQTPLTKDDIPLLPIDISVGETKLIMRRGRAIEIWNLKTGEQTPVPALRS